MDRFKRFIVLERTFEKIDEACDLVDEIMCRESSGRYNIIDYAIIGRPDYETGWDLGFISDNGLNLLKSRFNVVEDCRR